MESVSLWVGFTAVIVGLLTVDLLLIGDSPVDLRRAVILSVVWIGLGLAFGVVIFVWQGPERGLEFLAGFLIEKSLSADNLFVFMLLFSNFGVPLDLQRRVLFWGILGAMVMRGTLILLGGALVARFDWVLYLFGGFLIYAAIRVGMVKRVEQVEAERHPVVRLLRRVLPLTTGFRGPGFFVREGGRLKATPLLVVLVAVEATDLVFAVDSIPAIFAVTRDTFIVYSSNVFAMLGLRSLYLVLMAAQARLRHMRPALAIILGFAGMKLLLHSVIEIPVAVSMGVILGILSIALVASLRKPGDAAGPAHGTARAAADHRASTRG
jgi:tellurite resistance protein TerC